jgi:uncharacterized protein (DUF302 family)
MSACADGCRDRKEQLVRRRGQAIMWQGLITVQLERGSVPFPVSSHRANALHKFLKAFISILVMCLWEVEAMAADGLITIPSSYGPEETMKRLEAEVKAKGMTVFAHVDHAAGAKAVASSLRPTDLLIFGNAKGGTPLMQSEQTIGIDLPLKVLVWQDQSRRTWLSYNDPGWLAKRHGLGNSTEASISAIAAMLGTVTKAATQ